MQCFHAVSPPVGRGFASSVSVGCDERWRKPKVVFETKSTIVEFNRAGSVAVARLRRILTEFLERLVYSESGMRNPGGQEQVLEASGMVL